MDMKAEMAAAEVIMWTLDAGAMAGYDNPDYRQTWSHILGPLQQKAMHILSALAEAGFVVTFVPFKPGDKVRMASLGEWGRIHTVHRVEGMRVFLDAAGSYADAPYLEHVPRETPETDNAI